MLSFHMLRPLKRLRSVAELISEYAEPIFKYLMLMSNLVERRGRTEHPDYFDHILPIEAPFPTDKKELLHIGSVALQVMFAGWSPMADLFYGAIVFLLQNPEALQLLTSEIRESFQEYEDIVPGKTLMSLEYLHACIEETLRLLPSNNTGLPRISPGSVVDGQFIPKGVSTSFTILTPFPDL